MLRFYPVTKFLWPLNLSLITQILLVSSVFSLTFELRHELPELGIFPAFTVHFTVVDGFSQNVGIVAMTKVVSRFVLAISGVLLIIAGLSPKFSALMTTIPMPVLGGATITVFGMITLMGIQLVVKDELSSRNMTIVGLALALSMGISSVPEAIALFPDVLKNIIGGSPIVVAAFVSFTLNIVLPGKSLADEAREREAIEAEEPQEVRSGNNKHQIPTW